MGNQFGSLLGLGSVGAEYREPLGLVADYLCGREGGPYPRPNPLPEPLTPALDGQKALSRLACVCSELTEAVDRWGNGP
jgi:hypothetical protein